MASLALAACTLPGLAHATHYGTYPDCTSSVPAATSTLTNAGAFTSHGFGGGQIASLAFPVITGVTPPVTASEADVVGALLNVSYAGYLGGGTTQVRALPIGTTTSVGGAQSLTAHSFTGHYKAEPRTYTCESVVHPYTYITTQYWEFTLTGLLTPVAGGSPLRAEAFGTRITTSAGDTRSY